MMKVEGMGEEPWIKDLQTFLNRGPANIIRLRGLPYECTALQVIEFFKRGEQPANIKDGEKGVFFIKKSDGKSTGDAFVLFSTEAEASAAMTKHKERIGARYIELFRIAFSEVEQVVRRTLEAKSKPPAARLAQTLAAVTHPVHSIPSGTVRDCIRLLDLPFETQVHNLLDFLGNHSKNIIYQGVHMVFNHLGHPTGEAIVQMNSEASASLAAVQCNNRIIVVNKKQRRVEVYQCSGEDMNVFLSGGTPTMSSPGINEVVPFLPVCSPILEPRCLLPPAARPPTAHAPGPFLYVLVNPQERYIPITQTDWYPDYTPTSMLSQSPQHQHVDYFVS